MSLFTKRTTVTQNIAYMGIMAAVNVIAVVLMTYVPILFIPFVFVLPLTSTVVTLFCEKKYFLIYMVATIGICLLVTLNNISDTLFYIIPSVLSGFIFGYLIEKNAPSLLTIFAVGLLHTGLTYAFIPLIEFIYGQNIITLIASIFGLNTFIYLDYVTPVFILVISLIQATLTYAFIASELPKMGIENKENNLVLVQDMFGLVGSSLSLAFCFVFPPFSYFFLIFAVFFGVYDVFIFAVNKNFKLLIVVGIFTIIFIVLFATLNQYVKVPLGLNLFNILFDFILLTSLVNSCLTKNSKSVK